MHRNTIKKLKLLGRIRKGRQYKMPLSVQRRLDELENHGVLVRYPREEVRTLTQPLSGFEHIEPDKSI